MALCPHAHASWPYCEANVLCIKRAVNLLRNHHFHSPGNLLLTMSDVSPIPDQQPFAIQQQEEVSDHDAAIYADRDVLGLRNPLMAAAPEAGDLPPLSTAVTTAGFSVHPPPSSGYLSGCYLPSPPRSVLPPVGYYSSSYGGGGVTSCPPYPQPIAGPLASISDAGCGAGVTSYSLFPSLYGGSYNGTIPHLYHPLSDPNVSSTSDSPMCRKRRRCREEDELIVDDLSIPAKKIGATLHAPDMPTPPDSGSDSGSPLTHYPAMAPPAPNRQIPQPLPPPPPPQDGVCVMLTAKTDEMWNLFFAANTEMIVTKSGR